MKKEKQILLIRDFINSNDGTILINQVNDEITMFYLSVIEYFAKIKDIKIINNASTEVLAGLEDLFGTQTIQIYNTTSTKMLDVVLKIAEKKIIFIDYKNYKKLSSKFQCINGYQFEKDIVFFIRNELNIKNDELLDFCTHNPALVFSETSKFLINSHQYSGDRFLIEDKNHILDIRKSFFENKRNNLNIQILYQNIKKEVDYKKLSFLTY